MSILPHTDRLRGFACCVSSWGLALLAVAWLALLGAPPAARAQTAPVVISGTPTNGAVNVPTNSTIVFVFSQDMKTTVTPIASKPGSWVGNFAIVPTNLSVSGSWGADKRTLTLKCSPGWPYQTNITWTLNPPTNGATTVFPQFAGTNKLLLATVSGSFTTAPPPPPLPKIISVSPTNRAVEVPPLSPLVFTFDQDMDTNIQVVASGANNQNCGFSPTGSYSNGLWSADRRTLTFPSLGQLPLGVVIGWDLNPPAAGAPLQNLFGEPVAFTSGSFTVLTNTGGNPAESCQITTTTTFGNYTLAETLRTNIQLSAGTTVPLSNSLPTFFAFVKNPASDRGSKSLDTVTNASLSLPGGSVLVFTNEGLIVPNLGVYSTNTTDSVLMSAFPSGAYVLHLAQLTGLVSTITMTIPTPPPTPLIANYDAAQTIDAGNDFVLQWNSLPPAGPGSFIQLVIYDTYFNRKLIFAAPNPCVSRTLDPGATSVLIPANTFRPGVLYQGVLEFAYNFYHDTNAVPEMIGDGTVLRSTLFPLQTSLAANTATVHPTVSTAALSPNGQPVLTLQGAPGASYTIQRTSSLYTVGRSGISAATWTTVGTVTADGSGNGSFTDTAAPQLPAFYRVLGN